MHTGEVQNPIQQPMHTCTCTCRMHMDMDMGMGMDTDMGMGIGMGVGYGHGACTRMRTFSRLTPENSRFV